MLRTLVHGSVVLLVGSFAIGALASESGLRSVEPFVKGGLCLFLLDMELLAIHSRPSRSRVDAESTERHGSFGPVGAFAFYMPLIGAAFGLALGALLGFGVGGRTLTAVLGASGSYIAVPAAMRMALRCPKCRAPST